jgi:predicted nucleic acid-binding protein
MRWAIVDTSVYIGHWERGEFTSALETVRQAYVVRHSAVVLSELRRGARTAAAQRLVESLRRQATVIWAPTSDDWWQAGHLVRTIADRQHWDAGKRREFQNDSLIALTGCRHGATIITANRSDFGLLARATGVRVLPI